MYVTLQHEVPIVRYEVPEDSAAQTSVRKPSGSELIIVHDVNITSDYMVLFRARDYDPNQWDLMWKGSIKVCLSKFADEIEEWEFEAGFSKQDNKAS